MTKECAALLKHTSQRFVCWLSLLQPAEDLGGQHKALEGMQELEAVRRIERMGYVVQEVESVEEED